MRKLSWVLIGFVCLLITACSTKEDIELVDVNVYVAKGNSGSVSVAKTVYPSALTYQFTFQNTGNAELHKPIEVKIKPGTSLKRAVQHAAGFNVFVPAEYTKRELSISTSYTTPVKPKEEGDYLVNYELSLVALPPNLTQEIKKAAYDATLIITYKGKTIKEYPLDSFTPKRK